MTNAVKLLKVLLTASEKAANIARVCRQNEQLFQLLIEEKGEDEKNPRFFQDFKTLADVLIQDTIRNDIRLEFPELAKMVKGEESNVFSNKLGKTIIIRAYPSIEETIALLSEVLNDNYNIAKVLAEEIHRTVSLSEVPTEANLDNYEIDIDVEDLGIWIDPIDSTADYISGKTLIDKATDLHVSGLRCVSVLIGAHSKSKGNPVIGVINQPFYNLDGIQWNGQCHWAVVDQCGQNSINSLPKSVIPNYRIVMSRCDNSEVKTKLLKGGFSIIEVAGAGYKLLSVALGQADAYVLSKGTTYKWDTCAPHALLQSLSGGILDYVQFCKSDNTVNEVKYLENEESHANRGGLIAYRDAETLELLRKSLVLFTKL